jgi:hypothetical protein
MHLTKILTHTALRYHRKASYQAGWRFTSCVMGLTPRSNPPHDSVSCVNCERGPPPQSRALRQYTKPVALSRLVSVLPVFNLRTTRRKSFFPPHQQFSNGAFPLSAPWLLSSRRRKVEAYERLDRSIHRGHLSFAAPSVASAGLGECHASHWRSAIRFGRVPSAQSLRAS